MATIERVIDGVKWKVYSNGSVGWQCGTHARSSILAGELTTDSVTEAKTAIALYEEWQQLKAQEDLDAPPRVELPEGYSWRKARLRGGFSETEWALVSPEGGLSRVHVKGSPIYEQNRFCNAAADELASRRPVAEHETRGAK